MENNTFNPSQMPPMQAGNIEKPSKGPLIAVILILILIIIGGLYFLKERNSKMNYDFSNTQQTGDSITNSLNTQGTSDDLGSIEADLNATNFDNIDQGASVIEAELQ